MPNNYEGEAVRELCLTLEIKLGKTERNASRIWASEKAVINRLDVFVITLLGGIRGRKRKR